MVRVLWVTVLWDAMLRKAAAFARKFWRWIAALLFSPSISRLILDVIQDRRDNLINQLIDQAVSKMMPLQYLVQFLAWIADNYIPITLVVTLGVFLFLLVYGYIDARCDRTQTKQTLADIKTLPDKPDSQTFKEKLRQLYEHLERETFWHWPSAEAVNLYRELVRDFPSLQADMDEDARTFFESALVEARDELQAKGANI
jgi:hypothetical protein